jgi:hypothetical protein
MTQIFERLYPLLPTFYRQLDAGQNLPLRALLAVLEEPLQAIENDIQQLYDNSFIETCADWVVPYIGDLLGVRLLHDTAGEGLTLRAFVANTIAFRRRKGTPGMLERVAQDVTGWPAAAVESFQLLATTQNVNHLRLTALGTIDVRNRPALEALGGPFESSPYNVDIRSIAAGRGRYNIRNVGIFLWTLRSLEATTVAAAPAADVPPTSPLSSNLGFYRFSPLGNDMAIWSPRNTSDRLDVRQSVDQVPQPLERYALFQRFNALRAGTGDPNDAQALGQLFQIAINGAPVPPQQLVICNLTTWHRPAVFSPPSSPPGPAVAVDPVLGRIAISTPTNAMVTVTYFYGAPGEIGGGAYLRDPSDDSVAGSPPPVVVKVAGGGIIDQILINAAVAEWNAQPPPLPPLPMRIVIEIQDSLTYTLGASLTVQLSLHLQIRAARTGPVRPLLVASSSAAININLPGADSQLTLEGLWIAARFSVNAADSAQLLIAHCTLVPGTSLAPAPLSPPLPSLSPPAPPALPPRALLPSVQMVGDFNVAIIVRHSIMGPLLASSVTGTIDIQDSIVDNAGYVDLSTGQAVALALRAGTLTIQRTTVLGAATARDITLAQDSIFTGIFTVARIQDGCPRFCFLPNGSVTPGPFRCQPQMAIAAAQTAGTDVNAEINRVVPQFLSRTYGYADYGRLSPSCPQEIASGGESSGEMGVFQSQENPMRVSNLQASLDEYLRFGLEAGTFPAVRVRRLP